MDYDAHVCGPSVCAGEAVVCAGPGPKRDVHGKQLCEHCSARLCRTKGMKYKCGPGLMCQKCYNEEHPRSKPEAARKRPASAAEPVAPTVKRVRRTQSDPGEPM